MQLTHIKKSVLGPEAFDSFILAAAPGGTWEQLLPFCSSVSEGGGESGQGGRGRLCLESKQGSGGQRGDRRPPGFSPGPTGRRQSLIGSHGASMHILTAGVLVLHLEKKV